MERLLLKDSGKELFSESSRIDSSLSIAELINEPHLKAGTDVSVIELSDRVFEIAISFDCEGDPGKVIVIHLRDHFSEDDESSVDREEKGAPFYHFLELFEVVGIAHLSKQSIA